MTRKKTNRKQALFLAAITLLCALFVAERGQAHQVSSVSLISHLDTEKGTYLLDAAMEVVPSVDQAVNDQISPEDAAREFANEYLEILCDEKKVEPELSISIETASDENTPEELQRQQVLVKMTGEFPEGAKEFLLYLDPSCPMAVVMVTIKDDRPSRRMQVILAGEYSRPVNIQPLVEGDPFTEPGKGEPKATPSVEKPGDASPTSTDQDTSEEKSIQKRSSIIKGWLAYFGFSLVPALLPTAILLLTLSARPVFGQIAALVIGQSSGIALASFGIVAASTWTIPIAGLLLAVVAGEALFHRECKWWRYVIALVAGFFSGLVIPMAPGFSEVLAEGQSVSTVRLLGFIFGTEMGLVAAALVASGVLLFLSRFDWYRTSIVQPLTVLFSGYGIFLVIARFL